MSACASRVDNFFPGPGALPLAVLQRIRSELLDYRGLGMSVLELSHRSDAALQLIADTLAQLRRLLDLDERFELVLLQGGASLQFAMVPLNLSPPGGKVDYLDTGYWTARAIAEARRLGRDVLVAGSSAPYHHRLPADLQVRPDACYLHLCSNNTVEGTQWQHLPQVPVPLVVDVSSDILSRQLDYRGVACLYAHAQKTLGPAGVTVVALRRELVNRVPENLPTMLDYRPHIAHDSNYNTPPIFAIYVVRCVLDWLEQQIGGLAAMEALNRRKAALLYGVIEESSLFHCPVERDARSLMNVVFTLPRAQLQTRFLAAAAEQGLVGLAGHRSVGGLRASLYNPVSLDAVERLAAFMRRFERRRAC